MESTITAQIATNSSNPITGSTFLGFDYWFGTPLAASLNHWFVATVAGISTLLLILAATIVAMKFLRTQLTPPQQKFFTKLSIVLLTLGLLGWILTLARIFGVVFFSARFLWLLWLLLLAGAGYLLYKQFKKLPSQQIQFQTYQLKKRYFPKKKKR